MLLSSFTDPNAEPQTPTRTPTAPGFSDAFNTPKLESSFFDPRVTWNTADPYGSSPEFPKTPQRLGHGHARRASEAETVIEGMAGGLQYSPELSKGERGNNVDSAQAGKQGEWQDGGNEDGPGTTKRSAAIIQTPPPTSTGRRRLQDPNKTATPFNVQTPRQVADSTSHLETPSRVIGFSPGLFGQHTPGLFQFPDHSTTTSPSFFPQQRMPWDQEPDLPSAVSHPYSDSYVMSGQPNENFGGFDSLNATMQTPQRQPNRTSANHLSPFGSTHDNVTTSFFTSPRAPPAHDDDPAMFLSSPARRFGFQDSDFSPPIAPRAETRRPYHFQTQDMEQDAHDELRKLQRVKSAGRRQQKMLREEPAITRAQTVASRTAPRSSLYNIAPRPRNASQPMSSTGGPASAGVGVRKSPTKGRASPVKGHRPTLSRGPSSTLPKPMESVVLKIGKDGRAKTETVTQSPVRAGLKPAFGHGALSESEDGDTDDDDYPTMSFTQNQSFNVPDLSPLKRPSLTRSGSRSRPHSKSSSYSSASGRGSPWTGSSRSSVRRIVPTSRAPSITDSDVTQEEMQYNDEHHDEDTGDAQHALMQVIKQRNRPSVARQQSGYRAVGRTVRPPSTLPSSPPVYRTTYREIRPAISSPVKDVTDDDLTPRASRQGVVTGTRCVCKSTSNGGHLMIQW